MKALRTKKIEPVHLQQKRRGILTRRSLCVSLMISFIRKLPPVSSSIAPAGPQDDPSQHQGRIRTIPHIEGQFAAHVYVSLPLGRCSQLYKILQAILCDAKASIPTLHEIWTTGHTDQPPRPELHISLSRPIFLRAHQREDLKRAVKNIAKAHKP